MAVDKAHKEQSTAVGIFKDVGENVRQWMLTKMFFEASLNQLRLWLSAIEPSWDLCLHSD